MCGCSSGNGGGSGTGKAVVCMSVILIIVGVILSAVGGVQMTGQTREMVVANQGLEGNCTITSIGALNTFCSSGTCQSTFILEYNPLLYTSNKNSQTIPNGSNGYNPSSFTVGQVVTCYSTNFENSIVVVWKRNVYNFTTILLVCIGSVVLGISFIVMVIACLVFKPNRIIDCCC